MRLLQSFRGVVQRDPARAWLALLLGLDLAIIWTLPLLVGQDLPQHLSYARILADYADPSLPFRDTFTLPAHPQPYFTAYLLLAPLTRWTSVLTACRVLFSAYAVALALGFRALVRAVHLPDDARPRTPWTALFGPLLVWNPVECVGFLPFMLALPGVLFGAAYVLRVTHRSGRPRVVALVVAAAVTASLHLVAGASLVAFALCHALARRSSRALAAALVTTVATFGTIALWHAVGERGLAELPVPLILATMEQRGFWRGLVESFGVQWNGFDAKWAFVVATVLGPLAQSAKTAIAIAIAGLALVVLVSRKRTASRGPSRGTYGLTALAFTGLVVVTPTAIRLPDDICLLDFRLYVLAFMFALAWVTPRVFAPRAAHGSLAVFTLFVLAIWTRQLRGAASEALVVLRVMQPLTPNDRVLALPFHDRSEYLDENNSVTHYFPVYNTAIRGGVTSLFWGKFSHHLPVGYRPGREPARPPDWDPSQFTRAELLSASHVLVEWPDEADGEPSVSGALHLRDELALGFTELAREGRWSLYAAPSGVIAGPEARR